MEAEGAPLEVLEAEAESRSDSRRGAFLAVNSSSVLPVMLDLNDVKPLDV